MSSRDVAVLVKDMNLDAPVQNAHVEVGRMPVFGKLNARIVPDLQTGVTDASGHWHGQCANGGGFLKISATGYCPVVIRFWDDWQWPADLMIELQRDAGRANTATGSPPELKRPAVGCAWSPIAATGVLVPYP